jgi:hypothetical protein
MNFHTRQESEHSGQAKRTKFPQAIFLLAREILCRLIPSV